MDGNTTEVILNMSVEVSYALTIFISLQSLVGCSANILVIVTILTSRELRERSDNKLITNLAFADMFALVIFLPFHSYIINKRSILVKNMRFYEGLDLLSLYLRSNALLAVAIDRFIALVAPFRYNTFMTTKTTYMMIVVAWSLAIGLKTIETWLPRCSYLTTWITYNIALLFGMVVFYVVIFYITVKQSQAISKQKNNLRTERCSSRVFHIKATLTTLGMVFLYYLTYIPFVAYFTSSSIYKFSETEHWTGSSWMYSFSFLNSCINPFVYALRTKRFKKEFQRKIITKIWPEFQRQMHR